MPVRRANWLNLHSTRRYPLDDSATGTGDDGERLKDDILTDCHIRFPRTAGEFMFLSGINVTDKIVTLVFLAADSPTAAGGFVPLASISLPQPVEADINYPVSPLLDGVGGFVVFGDVSETFAGRFSTPIQGLVSPKCGRPYKPLPIPTIRNMGRDIGLEGIVTLKAGNNVEIAAERVTPEYFGASTIDPVDVIIIRLLQPPGGNNVLEQYIGPCDSRPESRNCLKDGIEAINEAIPDCDGNIEITFRNMYEGLYESCGGTTIDHYVDITEACAPRTPEKFAGRDLCSPSSSSSSEEPAPLTMLPMADAAAEPGLGPEFVLNFDDAESISSVHVVSGEGWQRVQYTDPVVSQVDRSDDVATEQEPYQEGERYSLAAYDLSRRSLLIADYGSNTGTENAVNQEVVTDLRFADDNPFDQCAGLIANYRTVDVLTNPHVEYFYAEVDKKSRKLRLWFFAGRGPYVLLGEARIRNTITAGHWYRMKLEITAHVNRPTMVTMIATLTGVSDPAWAPVQLRLTTNQYLPADGNYGLCAVRTNADFSYLNARDIHA